MFALRTTASLQRDKEVTPDATYITQSLTEPTVSWLWLSKKLKLCPILVTNREVNRNANS